MFFLPVVIFVLCWCSRASSSLNSCSATDPTVTFTGGYKNLIADNVDPLYAVNIASVMGAEGGEEGHVESPLWLTYVRVDGHVMMTAFNAEDEKWTLYDVGSIPPPNSSSDSSKRGGSATSQPAAFLAVAAAGPATQTVLWTAQGATFFAHTSLVNGSLTGLAGGPIVLSGTQTAPLVGSVNYLAPTPSSVLFFDPDAAQIVSGQAGGSDGTWIWSGHSVPAPDNSHAAFRWSALALVPPGGSTSSTAYLAAVASVEPAANASSATLELFSAKGPSYDAWGKLASWPSAAKHLPVAVGPVATAVRQTEGGDTVGVAFWAPCDFVPGKFQLFFAEYSTAQATWTLSDEALVSPDSQPRAVDVVYMATGDPMVLTYAPPVDANSPGMVWVSQRASSPQQTWHITLVDLLFPPFDFRSLSLAVLANGHPALAYQYGPDAKSPATAVLAINSQQDGSGFWRHPPCDENNTDNNNNGGSSTAAPTASQPTPSAQPPPDPTKISFPPSAVTLPPHPAAASPGVSSPTSSTSAPPGPMKEIGPASQPPSYLGLVAGGVGLLACLVIVAIMFRRKMKKRLTTRANNSNKYTQLMSPSDEDF